MNRRQILRGAITGAGAAVLRAAPAPPQPWPQAEQAGQGLSETGRDRSAAEAGPWQPRVFDAHQNDTVVALTELIIPATDTPGAKQAQVNRFIDLMLSESSPDVRRTFLQGLAWLDGYALRQRGEPFVRCSAAQQAELLRSLDPAANPPAELHTGVAFFQDIKRRTAAGYYTSKIGYDELNKGGRVPASFACSHGNHA